MTIVRVGDAVPVPVRVKRIVTVAVGRSVGGSTVGVTVARRVGLGLAGRKGVCDGKAKEFRSRMASALYDSGIEPVTSEQPNARIAGMNKANLE